MQSDVSTQSAQPYSPNPRDLWVRGQRRATASQWPSVSQSGFYPKPPREKRCTRALGLDPGCCTSSRKGLGELLSTALDIQIGN